MNCYFLKIVNNGFALSLCSMAYIVDARTTWWGKKGL